jgi:hypothetical protein
MEKLMSMTDFLLEQSQNLHNNQKHRNFNLGMLDFVTNSLKYARLLKQPLELWMFVPCDDDGTVLEEKNFNKVSWELNDYYQQAKERCLFDGFEIIKQNFSGKDYRLVRNKDTYVFFYDKIKNKWEQVNDYKTIESLVFYNLTITATALKQIGL